MADEDSAKPQVLRSAVRLGKPMRWTALGLGFAGLGAGGAAAFLDHLEAPPIGLLAVGLILALVGLSGVLPTRLKWGDGEAEWMEERERVAGVLAKQMDSASVEDRPKVAEIVERVAEVAPEIAEPALSVIEYEQLVGAALQGAGLGIDRIVMSVVSSGSEIDLVAIIAPDSGAGRRGRHIVGDITWGAIKSYALDRAVGKARRYARDHPEVDTVLLIVTRAKLDTGTRSYLTGTSGVYIATFSGPTDTRSLHRALRTAVTGPPIRID
jgi:hypothetical protein